MRKSLIVLAAVSAMGLALGCANNKNGGAKEGREGAEGDEVKMKFADVPAAVQSALTREANGAAINTVDREQRNGQTVYEADAMVNGKNWEIVVDPSGKLVSKKLDEEAEEKGEHKGGKEDKD